MKSIGLPQLTIVFCTSLQKELNWAVEENSLVPHFNRKFRPMALNMSLQSCVPQSLLRLGLPLAMSCEGACLYPASREMSSAIFSGIVYMNAMRVRQELLAAIFGTSPDYIGL